MPRRARGSTYRVKNGIGIRWVENGKRQHKSGFKNKTAAHDWFDREIAPRLGRGGPSAQITFEDFCREFLARYKTTATAKSIRTLTERLAPAREHFGRWTLAELEGAADDVDRWRSSLPSEYARYSKTRAMRQVLNAAVRWGYIDRNPASDFGSNVQPHPRDIDPFTDVEVERIVVEMRAQDAAMVILAVETGLRTNELLALERQDIDRRTWELVVNRRFSAGVLHQLPKTERRRRVPLTPRAQAAIESLPARLDTPLLFPAPHGQHIDLGNWRLRRWKPALDAAGVRHRNPYALRHTFATNALAAGVSTFDLSRLMGTSLLMIDRTYGHWATGREDHLRELLSKHSDRAREETG